MYTVSQSRSRSIQQSTSSWSCILTQIDHFTYYCLGSQGGKLWVVMRLLGPIACRKVCRNTSEITENNWSVVLNHRLPVSTFSPNHWSWRCHLLAPHWAEIVRLASGAERAREIKEKKQLAIADAGAAAAAAQAEGETSSRRACGSRKADRGTQETWGRNGASTCLQSPRKWECQLKSCALAYSLLRTWKETTISWGIHFWIVCRPVGSSLESVEYWVKGENPQPKCAANEERGRKYVRGAGRLAVVTLEDHLLLMTRWGSGPGGCGRSWHTFLVCRRLVCHSPFKKWISFLYLRLGRLPPWPSWEDVKASMAECFHANYPDTFIVLEATRVVHRNS